MRAVVGIIYLQLPIYLSTLKFTQRNEENVTTYVYTARTSKGVVYSDSDFEAKLLVSEYYRIETEDVILVEIHSLEDLHLHAKAGDVIAFLKSYN